MSSPIERVLERLRHAGCKVSKNGAGYISQCPVHDDRKASFSIGEGDDGRALLHCHAGCAPEEIVAALGLEMRDLFSSKQGSGRKISHSRRIVAIYDYTDEAGTRLFQTVRYEPKDFRQRRPDGRGGWIWNIQETRRVLFRLPAVLDAVRRGETIYVVEGEKDVLAFEEADAVATCNPGGAGKWRSEHTEMLRGAKRVVVVADTDGPGRKHAWDPRPRSRPGGCSLWVAADRWRVG